jgi:hypothetical protein
VSARRGPSSGVDNRFPGFDVLGQAPHWDRVTADLVISRTAPPPALTIMAVAARAADHLIADCRLDHP